MVRRQRDQSTSEDEIVIGDTLVYIMVLIANIAKFDDTCDRIFQILHLKRNTNDINIRNIKNAKSTTTTTAIVPST